MTPLNERHDLAMKIEALLLKPGVRATFEQEIGVFNDWCAEWKKGDAKWRKKHGYLFRKSRSARYRADLPAWEPSPWDRLCSVAVRDPDPRLSPLTVSLYGVTGDPPLSDAGRRLCLSWVGLAILHDLALQDDARVAPLAVALDQDHVQITQGEMVGKWPSWKPVMEMGVKVVEAELETPDQKQTERGQSGEADEGRRVPMGDVRAKIVREVKDALMVWRTGATANEANSAEAALAGGHAMRVLFRKIAVLRECARTYGANPVTTSILGSPALALDQFSDEKLEERGTGAYYSHICKEEFIDDLQRWGEGLANGPGQAGETDNTLLEGTEFWIITFQGKTLPAIRGREAFAYLAYVLTHPREWISAMRVIEAAHEAGSSQQRRSPELAHQADAEEEKTPSSSKGVKHRDSEDKADRTYLKECHEKLSDLRGEQQRAKDNGDEASADNCQQEIDKITSTLNGLTRPGGRLQKFTNEVDKAYNAIQKAVVRVESKVGIHSPELLRHLRNCIHFDKPCISYQPERPTEWHWAKPQEEKS